MWDNTHSWFTSKELVYSVTRQPSKVQTRTERRDSDGNIIPPPPPIPNSPQNGIILAPTKNTKPLRIILGTMTMASQVSLESSTNMIQYFIEKCQSAGFQGMSELDTARMYNRGKTETLLGKVLSKHIDLRRAVYIATKANPFKTYNENLRPENVKKQLNDSLRDLQRPSVDLFYLHSPDHFTNIKDTLQAVHELHLEGKFRHFGLSNYAAWEVMEIWQLCEKFDYIKPTVYQGMYNAITREVEKELFPCLRKLGIKFYAYNPLAGGLLSGRYTTNGVQPENLLENTPTDGRFGLKSTKEHYGKRYWTKDYISSIVTVHALCEEHNISLCDASLRWMVWHSELNCTTNDGIIIGASKMRHIEQNMNSLCKNSTQGPLPKSIVDSFDAAWLVCKGTCPSYNR